jgi:hypothetical protein
MIKNTTIEMEKLVCEATLIAIPNHKEMIRGDFIMKGDRIAVCVFEGIEDVKDVGIERWHGVNLYLVGTLQLLLPNDKVLVNKADRATDIPIYKIETVDVIENSWVFTVEEEGVGQNPNFCRKILADSSNMGKNCKEIIVNNKIKNGEAVWLECFSKEGFNYIKATNENEVTIIPEQIVSNTWDDVFRILNNPDVSFGTKEAMIRERYNQPTLKQK